jgi:nitroreductase
MEFQEVVRRRKMVRSFERRPIPPAIVDRILDNALRAPSAGFSQGWAFVALEGDETDRFWDLVADPAWHQNANWPRLMDAPLIVLPFANKQAYLDRYAEPDKIAADLTTEEKWAAPYWDIDVGMAALLMLLTAVDAGLGALFFGISRNVPALLNELGVPPAYRPIGALAIGYADSQDRPSPSLARGWRPAAEVIHRGRWRGAPR